MLGGAWQGASEPSWVRRTSTSDEVGWGWYGRFLTHGRIDQIRKYTETKEAELLTDGEGSHTHENRNRMNSVVVDWN